MRTLFSSLTSMSFAFIPGSSALSTTSLSFSKISTEGFHAVVDAGASQSLPKKPPNRAGSVLNSRKGSHLMSDIRLVSFQRLLDAACGLIQAFHVPRRSIASGMKEGLICPEIRKDNKNPLSARTIDVLPFCPVRPAKDDFGKSLMLPMFASSLAVLASGAVWPPACHKL